MLMIIQKNLHYRNNDISSILPFELPESLMTTHTPVKGIAHHVPLALVDAIHRLGDVADTILSVSSGILDANFREYLVKTIKKYTALVPNVYIAFITDVSLVVDNQASNLLKRYAGLAVLRGDNTYIYVNLNLDTARREVDILEVLAHELCHAVTARQLNHHCSANTALHCALRSISNALKNYALSLGKTLDLYTQARVKHALLNTKELMAIGTTSPVVMPLLKKINVSTARGIETAYDALQKYKIELIASVD